MRPVLLNMTGFGSFREPTEVDFTGAEFFALVGPTGAGKSTVIDAMTFALYGTVPRWDDRRKVAFALAPTVNRGTVRLVFDVGGARYLVARELRRSGGANPQVSVKNARLERLLDPAGLGEVGEPIEQLAADSLVTPGVEDLLGLEFDHFCTCVSLPQGDFAEFLHAKPSDRQRILTKLLGLGVYENIAREAGAEATRQRGRATVLGEQLVGYLDVTEVAEKAATDRVSALEKLAENVDQAVPRLLAAAQSVAEQSQTVKRISAERDQLAGITVPAGLSELDGRRVKAAETLAAAAAEQLAAEHADTEARERRQAAAPRGPLEQAKRDHAGLAAALAAEPLAATACQQAKDTAVLATDAANASSLVTDAASERQRSAITSQEAAETTANGLTRELDKLTDLKPPKGLAALGRTLAEAQEALVEARQALAGAQVADDAARETAATAPARGPLEQAALAHTELATALPTLPDVEARHDKAVSDHAAATEVVEHARAHQSQLRGAREAASRADLVAALRPQLSVGDECPVCVQLVSALPPALPAAGLESAEEALAAADRDLAAAQKAEIAAERVAGTTQVARDSALNRINQLRVMLEDAPATLAAAQGELAELDALTTRAKAADGQLRSARGAHDKAATTAEAARSARDAAGQSLRAARDPLVALGAPPPADDVMAGWSTLLEWAGAQAAHREAQLIEARERVAQAAEGLACAGDALTAAKTLESQARSEEKRAAAAAERAQTELEALAVQIDRLRFSLEGAPDLEAVTTELGRLDQLDAAAAAADARLLKARTDQAFAFKADQSVRVELLAERQHLGAARDRLVELGAPPSVGDDVLSDWTALVSWAHGEAETRVTSLVAAETERDARQLRYDVAGAALSDALSDADVEFRRVMSRSPRPPALRWLQPLRGPSQQARGWPNAGNKPPTCALSRRRRKRQPRSRNCSRNCSGRTTSRAGWSRLRSTYSSSRHRLASPNFPVASSNSPTRTASS